MLLASALGVCQREQLTGDLRLRLRGFLQESLTKGLGDRRIEDHVVRTLATKLEMCALAIARCDPDLEVAIVSRVGFNLGENGVHILKHHRLSKICMLSHRRMGAETAHALRDACIEQEAKNLLKDAAAAAAAVQQRATTFLSKEAITCPKCHTQDGIVRVAQQSRAADEGMTTKCFCRKCNQRWKLA